MFRISLIAFVSFLLFSSPQFAQQYTENNSQNDTNLSQDLQNYTTRATRFVQENTNGTPYLNENFEAGSLLNESNVLVSNVVLRYNALYDEFQVKKSLNDSEDNAQAVRKTSEIFIKMGGNIYTYLLPVNGAGGYYNILFEGTQINLYKKDSKKFVEGAKSVNMMTGDHPNRLVDESSYFIILNDGELVELTGSRNRKLQAIAGEKRNELRKYVKENKLNVNREEDLIQAVTYFNKNF